jgi:hypothetical protein
MSVTSMTDVRPAMAPSEMITVSHLYPSVAAANEIGFATFSCQQNDERDSLSF